MNDQKELILSSFKKGLSIEGISKTIHCEMNASSKKTDSKVTRYEARRIVEQTILEDYLKILKGAKS